MRRDILFLLSAAFMSLTALAQKKPLDHSVYDGWQSIGESAISANGKFVVYNINPQEGDGTLVIQASDKSWKKEIPRGYNASITPDDRYIIFLIKPFFKETRNAKIDKKTPDQSPKDSLGILFFEKDELVKIPRVKSYKTPEKNSGWLAYNLFKPLPGPSAAPAPADSLTRLNSLLHLADSLGRTADSLRNKATEVKTKGLGILQLSKKVPAAVKTIVENIEEGSGLVVKNFVSGEEKQYKYVSEYYFSKNGNTLIIETTRKNADTLSAASILWMNTATGKTDTVMKKFNDAKNYALDDEGTQLAFVAERDSVSKALQKFYKLWYYKPGADSALLKADRRTTGMAKGYTISPDYLNNFSKNGKRLFAGLALVRPPKDTLLYDFETARLDVWHYNDDYLQPQQQVQLNNELKRSYVAVLYNGDNKIIPLADDSCETLLLSNEGNALYALGKSTKGYRAQTQWNQAAIINLYAVNTQTGARKLVKEKIRVTESISPGGNFIAWYDWKEKNWFSYNPVTENTINITKAIKFPLFDEKDDHPADPDPYGSMGWQEGDKYMFIYDRYDVWKCDPAGKEPPVNITGGYGRKNKLVFRYLKDDKESRFITDTQSVYFSIFDQVSKKCGLAVKNIAAKNNLSILALAPANFERFVKAKNDPAFIFTKESFDAPQDIFTGAVVNDLLAAVQLSAVNQQQKAYNWLTTELHTWKMLDGKTAEGLLYKPANFDSTRKYPIIFYFYEKDADSLYNYLAPQPSRSVINIPYFVSNGYLVFDPNIYYKTGQPGEDAFNSVISAAKYLGKFKWVDTSKMALEGHSWGGYQVAYLVTRTNMFVAAEAGAPVANMTSAYGGIRWSSGFSRQGQYERGQSRLGASLWQQPDLYIKNSPLFRANKINTPLLMMHNDADGAVPWYQGIEMFTALRRLNKKVWMMQYNGEDHGLQERRNRKDWSIRLAQFFDYYLKGAPAPVWLKDGVPATLKGIDWGISQ